MRRLTLPFALLCSALVVAPASAATLTVTSTADSGAGSLRAEVGASGPNDTIVVPAGTYTVTSGPIQVSHALTLAGAGVGATTISGGHVSQLLATSGGAVAIHDLTLADASGGGGGAIENEAPLTLTNVALIDNSTTSSAGGAIDSTGPLTLRDVALTGNSSHGPGAIYQEGPLVFDRVLIADNTSVAGDGAMQLASIGVSSITNTTIADNTSQTNIGGWQVDDSLPNAMLTVQNSTIVGNRTFDADNTGGFRVGSLQNVELRNTVVADNTSPTGTLNCEGAGGAHLVTSLGHNVADTTATQDQCDLTGAGDQPGTDPQLGPLGDHGGPFQTLLPLAGSPTIDRGDAASCPSVDARGVPRPIGSGCDIGAVELATPSVVTGAPLAVTSTSATLTGSADVFGFGGTARFELGPTAAYGTLIAQVPLGLASGLQPVTTTLTGLTPATTYHARLDATNGDGAGSGADVTFTTPAVDAQPGPARPAPAKPKPVIHCVVPKLTGLTLASVRKKLSKAHCKLGKTTKPKHVAKRATLVVARQSPKASRKQRKAGTKVAVVLAVKKPAKPKHHKR